MISIVSTRSTDAIHSLQQSCNLAPAPILSVHSSLPGMEKMRPKTTQSQNVSVPETPKGQSGLCLAPTGCPALCFPYSQPSQGPGSSLPTGLGVWKPMKHGIVWAAQTQHLPGAWHLSSAALLLVNIWLTYPGEGWGLFAPHPNNPSSRKVSYSAGDRH